METPDRARRRTGEHDARLGGRSERVVREVLRATLAQLARAGYAALRVEDVAAEAGVNKTTVYRRWPQKPDLVAAAVRLLHEESTALPDTGSVRGDLLHLLRAKVASASTAEGRGLTRIVAMELDDPEVAEIFRGIREEFRAPWLATIQRAIARGELPTGTDPKLVTEMILSTAMTRLCRRLEPVDEPFLAAVVDLVVRGAQAGGGR